MHYFGSGLATKLQCEARRIEGIESACGMQARPAGFFELRHVSHEVVGSHDVHFLNHLAQTYVGSSRSCVPS